MYSMYSVRTRVIAIIAVLSFVALPVMAMIARGEEGLRIPRGLQIPKTVEPDRIGFSVREGRTRSLFGATPQTRPIEASVIVRATDGNNRSLGSGTVIGRGFILTVQHLCTRLAAENRSFEVVHAGKSFAATAVKSDAEADLMLLRCDAEIPAIAISETPVTVGTTVISIGGPDGTPVENEHVVTSIEKGRVWTSRQQVSGRSGGGLFYKDQLVGVIQVRSSTSDHSGYCDLQTINAFLQGIPQGYGSSSPAVWGKSYKDAYDAMAPGGKPLLVFFTAPWCGPCRSMKSSTFTDPKAQGLLNGFELVEVDGDSRADLVASFGVTSYPTFFVISTDRKIVKRLQGAKSADALVAELSEFARLPMSAGASGDPATITGWTIVQSWLQTATGIVGDGATASVNWTRRNGLQAIEPTRLATMPEIFGTSGRFEFSVKTATTLPLHELKFNYRFDPKGKLFVDLDEVGIDLPGTVLGAAEGKPTGSLTLIGIGAYELLSWSYTLYQVLHPQISLWLHDGLKATATAKDGGLVIDLGPQPPAIHADWSFFFGFVSVEYQRALTGLVIDQTGLTAQFHQARFYRDVKLLGK